jgi:long-chain acyl-CoA synthetase
VNPFAWLLWILDFLIWFITFYLPLKFCAFQCKRKCSGNHQYSFPDPEEDEGARRRREDLWDEEMGGLSTSPFAEGDDLASASESEDDEHIRKKRHDATGWDIFESAFEKYENRPYMGTRKYLGEHSVEGEPFPRKKFGETTWQTYGECGERIKAFGAGLRQFGMKPIPPGTDLERSSAPHTMLIFEETCADWLTSMAGAFSQSIAVATSYATLGISAVMSSITECNVSVCVCNVKNVDKVIKDAPPCLKFIIYTQNLVEPEKLGKVPARNAPKGIQVYSVEEVIQLGRSKPCDPTPPTRNTMAVIMYTSGSTGKPKGVMLPHRCLAAAVSGLSDAIGLEKGKEVYVAYLPAAHILELCAEVSMTHFGASLGFADPKTISSKGACREDPNGNVIEDPGGMYPPGAIQEFAPTVMAAVPIIWDIMKKGAEDVIGKKPSIVQWLFQVAYAARYAATKSGRDTPLFNLLVFKNFRTLLGGRLKLGVTGGGPISDDVQSFIRTAFGANLLQGYALTETCSAGCVQDPYDPDDLVVGGPVSCVEIKLDSCSGDGDPSDREGHKYLMSDDTHLGQPCQGRGEVCIKGDAVSLGYFKQPEKTREAFQPDGWFRTGDIGVWDDRGRLKIVDRLKNLVKLFGGEYVAIENMEKEYNASAYVNGLNGGTMIVADGEMRKPAAIVQVNMSALRKWARSQGIDDGDSVALCNNAAARKMVLQDMVSTAKAKLGANEIIGAVYLVPGEGDQVASITSAWSPDNGCQTASKKLERRATAKVFEQIIDNDLKPKCK